MYCPNRHNAQCTSSLRLIADVTVCMAYCFLYFVGVLLTLMRYIGQICRNWKLDLIYLLCKHFWTLAQEVTLRFALSFMPTHNCLVVYVVTIFFHSIWVCRQKARWHIQVLWLLIVRNFSSVLLLPLNIQRSISGRVAVRSFACSYSTSTIAKSSIGSFLPL